jgi:hypothetical protein
VPSFQNYTGAVESDMLRLNLAIPPTLLALASEVIE